MSFPIQHIFRKAIDAQLTIGDSERLVNEPFIGQLGDQWWNGVSGPVDDEQAVDLRVLLIRWVTFLHPHFLRHAANCLNKHN